MLKSLLAVIALSSSVVVQAQQQNFPFWDDPNVGGCALTSKVVHAAAQARELGVGYAELLEKAQKQKNNETGTALLRWVYAHDMVDPDNITRDFTKQCLRAPAPRSAKVM